MKQDIKVSTIATMMGAFLFMLGYTLNRILSHSSNMVWIGNSTNSDTPSFQCSSNGKFTAYTNTCVQTGIATGICGIKDYDNANQLFWIQFQNYNPSYLTAACNLLLNFCETKNYQNLYPFISHNATKNSTNNQIFFGNCEISTVTGIILQTLGGFIFLGALICLMASIYTCIKNSRSQNTHESLLHKSASCWARLMNFVGRKSSTEQTNNTINYIAV